MSSVDPSQMPTFKTVSHQRLHPTNDVIVLFSRAVSAQLYSILSQIHAEFPFVKCNAPDSLTPEVRATIVLCERETQILVRKFLSACVGNDVEVTVRLLGDSEFPECVTPQPTLLIAVASPDIVPTTDIAFHRAVQACSTSHLRQFSPQFADTWHVVSRCDVSDPVPVVRGNKRISGERWSSEAGSHTVC